jgi:hypothetical protein
MWEGRMEGELQYWHRIQDIPRKPSAIKGSIELFLAVPFVEVKTMDD